MDGLDVPHASLLGHHSGASIALIMATQQPRRVKALALWGVPLMTDERVERLGGEGQPDWDHAEDWICKRWEGRRAASGSGWTAEIGRRALLELLQAGPNSQWLHNAVARTPIEPYLSSVQQPVLTICGELDSLYAESEEAAGGCRMAASSQCTGASLDVADQDGIAFVDLVDGFLLRMRRAFVTLSGGRQVHYRLAGSGAPTVLLHATPDSSAALDDLASARMLIALDMPGYGESDPLQMSEPSMEDYAGALRETFDALDLESADIVGWGSGATMAAGVLSSVSGARDFTAHARSSRMRPEDRDSLLANYAPSLAPSGTGHTWCARG